MELKKKQISEFAKEFTHVSKNTIKVRARDYKTERGLRCHLAKLNAENVRAHTLPQPVLVTIEISWRKSLYGWCPKAEMRCLDEKGGCHYDEHAGYASGYGYDKLSTVVASALNKNCSNLLYKARNKRRKNTPYGINDDTDSFPSFEGGVGISCYPRVMAWLGYEMKNVASNETYDKYVIVKKGARRRLEKEGWL